MKIYIVSLCIGAVLCSAHGGLLKDVVGTIHEKAHNIREDIKSVLHHKTDNHSKNSIADTDVKHSTTEKTDSEVLTNVPDIKKETTTEKAKEVSIDTRNVDIVFPTEETKAMPSETDVAASTTSESSTKKNDKDGRENFTGGCATGFKKTADGRCKPTF